jgi:NTE family protein
MARIGLALGSGAARGWAHIGVVRALAAAGIEPEVVCGASIGAVVGAAFAAGEVDAFESWVRGLDWRRVVGHFDLALRGGLIKARRIFDLIGATLPDRSIESLRRPFGAVATDLATGQEVWLRRGALLESLRASVALPGLVAPVWLGDRWLVDGGLVNPVPVSLCRALGADVVIAVDLNTTLLGRRLRREPAPAGGRGAPRDEPPVKGFQAALQEFMSDLRGRIGSERDVDELPAPSMYDVVTNSINIMQVRITRSRMAGDPPELLVAPQLVDYSLLDFDRAADAIEEGRRATQQALATRPSFATDPAPST